MKTIEEYFIQQHGGKTPDQSVNDGETFTAIAMTIFASEFSQESNKELLDALDELRKSSLIYSNRLEQQIKELLSELEEFKSKVKGLSDLNNECIMKLRNNESYIHELESTVFNSEANLSSVQSQLQESQQMNERLVSEKSDLIYALIKAVKTEFSDQNWDYLDFIAERVLQSTTQEKGDKNE